MGVGVVLVIPGGYMGGCSVKSSWYDFCYHCFHAL